MSNNFTLNIYPNNLTEMRKKRGLTLKELAKCAGVGESTMYNMKQHRRAGRGNRKNILSCSIHSKKKQMEN